MSTSRVIGLLGLLFVVFSVLAHDGMEPLPAERAFPLSAQVLTSDRVSLHWDIAEGYHLYRNKFRFRAQTSGVSVGEIAYPKPAMVHDETFGDMEVYRGPLTLIVPLIGTDRKTREVDLEVTVQGCADAGLCYPPYRQTIHLRLPAEETAIQPVAATAADALSRFTRSLTGLVPGAGGDDLLPPDEAFRFHAEVTGAQNIHVSWQIADGYYLYRDRFRFSLQGEDGVALQEPVIPRGQLKVEDQGPVEVFFREVAFDLPLLRSATGSSSVHLQARFQGCAERGVCYPPIEKTVALDLPAVTGGDAATALPPVADYALAEQDRIAAALETDSAGLTALTFFGFGLLMAFSPCIFPMIPILSGIIVGHGASLTPRRAFLLSLVYVLAAALAYTVFGVLAGLFGSNLQAAMQTPWVIVLFSAIFVLLALSMFGFYELQLPGFIQERIAALSYKQKGGTLWGAAIMGALSALIVGPCMAAPLAGALIFIGQSGDALLGGLALFSLGLGMGVPLLIMGTSAGRLLPKAGMWMNAVKAVFGVVMLAMAVWLLQRVVPGAVAMILWALLLIIPAVYLNALDALPQPASGWHRLWKGIGVAMLAYGVLLLIGAAANGRDPLQPLRGVFVAGNGENTASALVFARVRTPEELRTHLAAAQAQGRWVMLDFYADWCVSCLEMERYTFTDARVKAALAQVVLIQADVTANEAAQQRLLRDFGLIGPPAILFFGPDGVERREARVIGYMEAEAFLGLLKRVLQ